MRMTTIGEWGARFPIGIPVDGGLLKTFELRPFKAKHDRFLGIWKEANDGKYSEGQFIAALVAKVVSMICDRVGSVSMPVTVDGDSPDVSELKVYDWHFADVMYLYFFSRIKSLGSQMKVSLRCPNVPCMYSGEASFDLNEADVRVAETPDELRYKYKLEEPILLRDKETRASEVTLAPIKWSTMTKPGVVGGSIGSVDLASLQDSIVEVNGQGYLLAQPEIDELSKLDFVRINQKSEDASAGIDLRTKVCCPECGFLIQNPLDWSYDYFFGRSLP